MFWKYFLAWFIGFIMGGTTVLEIYFRLLKKEITKKGGLIMILRKHINTNSELYKIEINTNDEIKNIVTLYYQNNEQPIMQIKYDKTENEDYIKLAKDIVIRFENGDKNECSDFFRWNGYVLD